MRIFKSRTAKIFSLSQQKCINQLVFFLLKYAKKKKIENKIERRKVKNVCRRIQTWCSRIKNWHDEKRFMKICICKKRRFRERWNINKYYNSSSSPIWADVILKDGIFLTNPFSIILPYFIIYSFDILII